jgi:hypothetical protein
LQPVLLNEGKGKKKERRKENEERIGKSVIQCLIMQERERERGGGRQSRRVTIARDDCENSPHEAGIVLPVC